MTPAELPLTMRRNEDPMRVQFAISSGAVPLDMTVAGYAARLQVRLYAGAAGDPILDIQDGMPTGNGSVVNLADTGFELVVYKADVAAGAMPSDPPEKTPFVGAYDIVITAPGGDSNPWYRGSFTVEDGVVP